MKQRVAEAGGEKGYAVRRAGGGSQRWMGASYRAWWKQGRGYTTRRGKRRGYAAESGSGGWVTRCAEGGGGGAVDGLRGKQRAAKGLAVEAYGGGWVTRHAKGGGGRDDRWAMWRAEGGEGVTRWRGSAGGGGGGPQAVAEGYAGCGRVVRRQCPTDGLRRWRIGYAGGGWVTQAVAVCRAVESGYRWWWRVVLRERARRQRVAAGATVAEETKFSTSCEQYSSGKDVISDCPGPLLWPGRKFEQ